jgi:outer membrane immunogenic protein
MKKLLLTSVALLSGAAGSALAADLPAKMPVKALPTVPPPFSWTGCCAGAHGGYGWGKTHDIGADATAKNKGWLAGGQIGCDYQLAPKWVVGVEAMAAWTDVHSTNDPFFSGKTFAGNFSTQTNWIASATARLGFGMERWLIYAKGGAAWSDEDYRNVGNSIGGPFDFRGGKSGPGWTAGAGIEWMFAPNWSAKIEFNHYDFRRRTARLSDRFGDPSFNAQFKSDLQTVIVGVNYRFATGGR